MLFHQFFLQTGEKRKVYHSTVTMMRWKLREMFFKKFVFPPSKELLWLWGTNGNLCLQPIFFLNHIIQWKSFQDTCSWLASIVTYLNAAQANMTGPWWGWSPQLRKNLSRAWKMKSGIHSYSIIVLSFKGSNRLLNRNIPQVRLSPGVNDAVNSCQ